MVGGWGAGGGSAWAEFAAARDQAAFCGGWLKLVCGQIGGVKGGVLLLGPDEAGDFAPAALWPDGQADLRYLAPVAERVLADRRGLVVAGEGGVARRADQPSRVGYPIEVDGEVRGVAVLDLGVVEDARLAGALRQLHWASAWIAGRVRERVLAERDGQVARLSFVAGMAGVALEERGAGPAALAIVNRMAVALKCDRVSLGIRRGQGIEVVAISNAAGFERRLVLARLIGAAMEEMLDLEAVVVHPLVAVDEPVPAAHVALAQAFGDVAVCSVPLLDGGRVVGAITLERGGGAGVFDEGEMAQGRAAGALLGPIVMLKREGERPVVERFARGVAGLFGGRRPGAWLVAGVVLVVGGFLALAEGPYRVTARTVVEAAVQRAVVAPFDGHIAAGLARAGDVVAAGQVIGRLDARDLALELRQQVAEREQAVRRERQALAGGERAAQAVAAAQVAQIDAAIGLLRYKLDRAALVAPFDGVVISGDLDQLLGAPVEQGRMLFQVAPLDGFRVVMQVDERDVAAVAPGQVGVLTLAGLPDLRLELTVRQVVPVASQVDGANVFRVEAVLGDGAGRLRPGMEGVAKIEAGPRRLLWIWTHGLVDWAGLWLWRMRP